MKASEEEMALSRRLVSMRKGISYSWQVFEPLRPYPNCWYSHIVNQEVDHDQGRQNKGDHEREINKRKSSTGDILEAYKVSLSST